MCMKSTRQRILDYLRSHQTITAEELSHAMHMTPANIRHHLAILRQRGLVEIVGERPPKGRGRPAKVFSLAHRLIGDNLGRLAGSLLEVAWDRLDAENPMELLRALAKRIRGEMELSGNLTQRLFSAVQRLNELNYKARWEAHIESPRIHFGHCPYANIIQEHPELCMMDSQLLEEMVGSPARQIAKLARDSEGGTYCKFIITETS
jgi:predicted ArsR family transcriptional regulator